jgi:mono/diheme cytochrome c family protein
MDATHFSDLTLYPYCCINPDLADPGKSSDAKRSAVVPFQASPATASGTQYRRDRLVMRRHDMSRYSSNDRPVSRTGLRQKLRKVLAATGLVALFWAPHHAALAQQAQDDVIEAGRQQFSQKCMVCHGPVGKGDGVLAPHLTEQAADLSLLSKENGGTFPFWETYSKIDGREIEIVRTHGTSDMPVWGTDDEYEGTGGALPMGQILTIVFFLQSIQEE